MVISFPNDPFIDQTYTVGVKTWIWNGYAWDLQVANTSGVTAFAQQAFNTANSASSNTVYTQGVDNTQNTRLSTVEANTVYLFDALNQTNTNIVNANTQLKAYTDGAIDSANTQLKSYTDGAITTSVSSANTQLKSYTDGAIFTSVSSANTQMKSYTDGAIGSANTQLKSYVDGADALKFNISGGNITGPVTISSNLTITGNLTVAGNVTTVSANNLVLKDNMIYLNDGSTVANPDLGIAGNYNDGIYRHAGFFRDASDGYWKVYDQYLPEPDASPYIDTSNSSFRIADFQANNVTFGKITTSSTQSVTNLNADYLDGQHGTYYTGYSDSANTQLKSYTDGAIGSANTQLKSYVDGFISYGSGVDTTQNTNITTATNLAQNAYNQANTDVTSITIAATTYGNTSSIPVMRLSANGRVSSVTNTTINIDASFITSGTISTSRLATGTANSSTYLRGDNTWQVITGGSAVSTRRSTVTATGNQTVFTTPAYTIGQNEINVFINGVRQLITTDFTETTSSSITLTSGAYAGDVVAFEVMAASVNPYGQSASISDDVASNAILYPMLSGSASGSLAIANTSSTKLTFNPSTGNLFCTLHQTNSLGVGTASSGTTGEIRATNAITSYYSDENLKIRLGNIDNAIQKVMSLNGFYYEPNQIALNLGYTLKREVGLSAQEVQKVMPEIVVPAPIDEKYLTIHYERMVPLLLEAIKEQQDQIDELRSIINSNK